MDFCLKCGAKNDPDSTSCRACGTALIGNPNPDVEATSSQAAGSPKIELISRGWDEVVETVEAPADPFEDEPVSPDPLPPGSIEVAVDDITIIESEPEEETEAVAEAKPVDPWDHLRPHGDLPPLQRRVSIPARFGQVTAVLAAIGALASAGIHFFLNTRLEASSEGRTSNPSIEDIELAADWSLVAVAGLVALVVIALLWWRIRMRSTRNFRGGKAGWVALLAFLAGSAVTGASFAVKKETVNEAIAANSLIVLGLGLVLAACLAVARTVSHIERREPT